MLLSGDEDTFIDDGLLGFLIHSLKDVKDMIFPKEFVDKGSIVDVIHSFQILHVPHNVDVDCVWKVEGDLIHHMEEHKFMLVRHKVFSTYFVHEALLSDVGPDLDYLEY